MIEIRVTGSTAEEIRESMVELNKVVSMGEFEPKTVVEPKKEEAPKEVKAEPKTSKKAQKETKKPIEESEPQQAEEPQPQQVEEPQPQPQQVEEPQQQKEETQAEPEATCTLVQVREKAVELQRAGKKDFVKQVLNAYGANKLSEVKESDYAKVMNCFETGEINDEEVPF